ncbi:MAG TPA: Co2+/Mg2+ efflux protein ApaG [Bacteriovoracaceae bacterium]|nr:Co2+/Mg2+ efflux protein ApaG [Bacteriovoracaceae bacterium]
MDYPFVAINNNFKIEIATDFDFDQSNPLQYHYLFKYTIVITNVGKVAAQLVSRKWNIKDAKGEVKYVDGPGVIGQTPYFEPGRSFEYQSFCPLPTMKGEMWGHFNMVDDRGQTFKIDTPIFKFHVPREFIDSY